MRLLRVIIIIFCFFSEPSLLYAESNSEFLQECNAGCLNTKFTFDWEQTACTLGCQKQAVNIHQLNVYQNSTPRKGASEFLKECNTGCLNTKFTFDSEQAACTLGCQKHAGDIGRLNVYSNSTHTVESASLFLKECNTGCLNTKFTFDSEQVACTLGCQKQAADIGRSGASGDSGLTCPKAKLEMDKGLMRIGYDEYKRLDDFYSSYCL